MSQITIKILYFAAAREKVGKTEENLEFAEKLSLSEVQSYIYDQYPALKGIQQYLRWAVEKEFEEEIHVR